MKRIIIISALVASTLLGMGQSRSEIRKAERAQKELKQSAMVDSLLACGDYVFVAERAVSSLPNRPYFTLSGVNDILISKDKIESRLPFYGQLYSAPIGVAHSPLSFTDENPKYTRLTDNPKKNLIRIEARNAQTGWTYTIILEVFSDATAVANITMTNGSSSMFFGYIEPKK